MITLLLFGLSAIGFGLFLGRILFSPAPATASDAASSSAVNFGASPRTVVAHTKVALSHEAAAGEPFEGWVTDRSIGGLGLSVTQQVASGTVLRVSGDPLPEWVSSHYLEVRYCRLHRGRWRLGCEFVKG